jgi:hypothetical protein
VSVPQYLYTNETLLGSAHLGTKHVAENHQNIYSPWLNGPGQSRCHSSLQQTEHRSRPTPYVDTQTVYHGGNPERFPGSESSTLGNVQTWPIVNGRPNNPPQGCDHGTFTHSSYHSTVPSHRGGFHPHGFLPEPMCETLKKPPHNPPPKSPETRNECSEAVCATLRNPRPKSPDALLQQDVCATLKNPQPKSTNQNRTSELQVKDTSDIKNQSEAATEVAILEEENIQPAMSKVKLKRCLRSNSDGRSMKKKKCTSDSRTPLKTRARSTRVGNK